MSGERAEASVDRIDDVLSDSWHADGDTTSDDMASFEQVLRQSRWPVGLARGYLRGVAIFVLGRRARLFLVNYGKAARVLILLEAFTGKRRVVLLDLIRPTPSSLRTLILRLVDAPSMRRAVRQVHVFTKFEVDEYSSLFGLARERIVFIHFPMLGALPAQPPQIKAVGGRRVFASGRAACDWPTLFRAANGADCELTVVCGASDAAAVEALNDGRARIFVDIRRSEHDRLLAESDVMALALYESYASSGHVRISGAIQLGVPVVAAATRSITVPGAGGASG